MREAVAVLTVWRQLISRVRTRGVFRNEEEQRKPPGAGIHMFRQRLPTKWPEIRGTAVSSSSPTAGLCVRTVGLYRCISHLHIWPQR